MRKKAHNSALKNIEQTFELSLGGMRRMIRDFHSEMKLGLSGKKSSLEMIPAYAERPKGTEKGKFLALDLGGTNFRVLAVDLKGKGKSRLIQPEKFRLTKKYITGTEKEFFGFIANSIKHFMKARGIDPRAKQNIGFTFSFPVKQTSVASGILITWTKGFRVIGVEGKDVVKLLNGSLKKAGLVNARVVALSNDTVSTFAAKSYEDQDCDVGVILGTGTNACYSEKISNITKWKGYSTPSGEMLINMEWGNFDKVRLTSYDRDLDKASSIPGQHLFEKMVSGMYLGEITRLVLRHLIEREILFGGKSSLAFNEPYGFQSEYMSLIEADCSKNFSKVKALLGKLGVSHSTYSDRKMLKRICAVISTRAARMAASAMAAVVTKIDPRFLRKHTIAIDGSVYEKHPGFSKRIRAGLKEIFGKKASKIKLSLTKDASGRGAAIIAATAST